MKLVVEQTIEKQGWRPMLEVTWEMPCDEDLMKWNTNVYGDFLRRWYHTRSERVQTVSPEECMEHEDRAIVQRLNEEADTARRYLDVCELEVLESRYVDNFVLKLLYEIINKKTSRRVQLPEGVFDMTTAVHGIYEE